jgi:hypothetical protein
MTTAQRIYKLDRLNEIDNSDEVFILSIVQVFLENAPITTNNLVLALKDNNLEMIYFWAHKLKSNINLFCIESIMTEIKNIELFAKANTNTEKIPGLVKIVDEVMQQAITEIKTDFKL